MNKIIICFTGVAGSGKDTAAEIANYILQVGCTRATFSNFVKENKNIIIEKSKKQHIFHFADNLKKVLSILYGIELNKFYDREYKDNKYYNLINGQFIIKLNKNKEEITLWDLDKYYNNNLNYAIQNICSRKLIPLIKLRTLMQYVSNIICKNQLDENIWIKNVIFKINDLFLLTNCFYAIIADVRFLQEVKLIRGCFDKSIIIKLNRNVENSDIEYTDINKNIEPDYIIDNNYTRQKLFYTILNIIQNEITNN